MIVVLLEGQTDKGFIETLFTRLNIDGKVRVLGGNNPNKARRYINSFLAKSNNKIVILKDLHRHSQRMLQKIISLIERPPQVTVVIVKHAIESWFLADPAAIRTIFGHSKDINEPEKIPNPDEELDKIAQQCGKRYIKGLEIGRKFAQVCDIRLLKQKCESFKKFLEVVGI